MNPVRGDVPLVIDGETRILRLTFGALAEIEQALGTDSLEALAVKLASPSASDLPLILAALLRGGGDPETADALGTARLDLKQALGAIAQAFAAGLGTGESPGKPPTGADGAAPG